MTNILTVRGTADSLLSTELNSLATNTNAVHSTSVTLTSANFLRCELELVVNFASAPTANTGFVCWLLREIDGSNFEDGGSSVTPLRIPDAFFPVRAVTGVQRIVVTAELPPGLAVKPLLRNDGTGRTIASSGNTLKIRPLTESI